MKTTTRQEDTMRGTFTQNLIVGLFKIRNRYDDNTSQREWLRQAIRLERKRRGK